MATESTKELYKKLRAASMSRDSAEVRSLLQQIVQMDPSDESASRQLKAMNGGVPGAGIPSVETVAGAVRPAAGGQGTHQKSGKEVSKLYAKFRSACLAKDDSRAFELIDAILRINPNDEEALKQRKKLGLRVACTYAPGLEKELSMGDVASISKLVEKLLDMADADDLLSVPNFAAAYSLHKEYKRKQYEQQVVAMLLELVNLEQLFDREQKAKQVEEFASAKGVLLNDTQKKLLQECHDVWAQECLESEQYGAFNKIVTDYNKLREEQSLGGDPALLREKLDAMQAAVRELTEVPEGENLLKQMQVTRKNINTSLEARHRRSRFLLYLGYAATFVAIVSGGIGYYAYENVDARVAELKDAHGRKDAAAVRALLHGAHPLAFLYSSISTQYSENVNLLKRWLKQYDNDIAQIAAFEKWLDENIGKITPDNFKTCFDEVNKYAQLLREAQEKYNYKPSVELQQKIGLVQKDFSALKAQLVSRFCNPAADATVEKLAAEYESYRTMRDCLSGFFSEEETKRIHQAFVKQVERLVLICKNDLQSRSALRKELQKYAATLELDQELLLAMDALVGRAEDAKSLPQKLQRCETLSAYLEVLKQYADLPELPEIPKRIEALQPQIGTLKANAALVKAHNIAPETKSLNATDLFKKLDAVRKVYDSTGSFFTKFSVNEYTRIVDLMTLPLKGPEWSDKFEQVVKHRIVYVGKSFKINNSVSIQEMKPNMKLSQVSISLGEGCDVRPFKLSSLRKDTGFDRIALQSAKVLPTTLMMNLARLKGRGYPSLTKAYLFSLSVDLFSLVNPLDSGLAFSPVLKKDLEDFDNLKSWLANEGHPLESRCWCTRHPVKVDDRIERFLETCAKHDYAKDIQATIDDILRTEPRLAGYFNSDCCYVSIKDYPKDGLYSIENAGLVPLNDKTLEAYTPVFYVAK